MSWKVPLFFRFCHSHKLQIKQILITDKVNQQIVLVIMVKMPSRLIRLYMKKLVCGHPVWQMHWPQIYLSIDLTKTHKLKSISSRHFLVNSHSVAAAAALNIVFH